ncbi:hypothetical protein BHE74_00045178 [Ensete ventricosum]|nr:hypothetical protein BHE74_00045178 [Ensete ventricosum]
MRVAVCLSIDQGELLGGHSGVEAGGRKGQGSDDESSGAQLPKSKASVRNEVDSEEHHSAAEVDLPIAKGCRCKSTDSRAMGLAASWYAEAELLWSHRSLALIEGEHWSKRGRGGGECRDKLQVPRQDGRAKAKELHKTGVDGLLIKITESEGLRVDAGVLDKE